jgi:hypothetical protein
MQRLAFARESQNLATTAALLDTLPAPSADGVARVYCQLKDILGITPTQQAESPLQRQGDISILSLGCSKGGRQKAAMEPLAAGTTSSPVQILAHDLLNHRVKHAKPRTRYRDQSITSAKSSLIVKPTTIRCKSYFMPFYLQNASSCTILKVTQSMWSHHMGLGKSSGTALPREGLPSGLSSKWGLTYRMYPKR